MDLSLVVACFLIIIAGLPHGALDPVLAYRYRLYTNNQGAIRFHFLYLLISLIALGIWIFIPVISLACFLLYSIVHFGRDWSDELPYKGLAYGCIILGAPALFHQAQVDEIFKIITFNQSSLELVYFLQATVACGMALMLPSKSTLSSKLWLELIGLFCAAIILEPLWYFLIYFCFLHSPKHLMEEWRQLSRGQKKVAKKIVILITVATCLLVSGIVYFFGSVRMTTNELAYQAIFIGLATLTIPHMLLMGWIQSHTKKYAVKDKVNFHVV